MSVEICEEEIGQGGMAVGDEEYVIWRDCPMEHAGAVGHHQRMRHVGHHLHLLSLSEGAPLHRGAERALVHIDALRVEESPIVIREASGRYDVLAESQFVLRLLNILGLGHKLF